MADEKKKPAQKPPTLGQRVRSAFTASLPVAANNTALTMASGLPSLAAAGLGTALGIGRFAGPRSDAVRVVAQPKQAAAAPATTPALNPVITPQDRAMAALDSILRQPFTLREFEAATGALPGVTTAGIKPQSTKNVVLGKAADLSQQEFAAAVAKAQETQATDPVGAQDIVAQARDVYLQRLMLLSGANPLNAIQAQMMDPNNFEGD